VSGVGTTILPRGAAERPAPASALPGPGAADARHLRTWLRCRPLLVLSLLLAVAVPAIATLGWTPPGRPVLAVAFLTLVPGLPVALALRLPSSLLTLALGVATSFAFGLLEGTVTLVSGFWHPVGCSWAALPVALAAALVARVRAGAARRRVLAARLAPRPPRPLRTRLRAHAPTAAGLLVLAAATALWWWGTRLLPLREAGPLGLLPLLGWRIPLALVLAAGVGVAALVRPRVDHVLLVATTVVLALVAFASVSVADGYGSVPTAWVHVGFVQYVSVHGAVPTGVDARFSWPAFWGFGAQLVALAGVGDARSFLVLAPVFSALVNLPALLVIGRVVTGSLRWAWVASGVVLLTNWYQQDYFAPQSVAFTTYLAVLATLLWSARTREAEAPSFLAALPARARAALGRVPEPVRGVSTGTSRALGLLLVVLVAGIVAGHQLTPITLVLSLVVFTVTGRTRYRALWLVAAVALAGWFSYGALDFWRGHLENVLGDVGQVGSSLGSGVSQRLTGEESYQRAQYVRIAWSGLLFAFGALGVWTVRRRSGVVLWAGLAAAPFGILGVQSYGGEAVIRCFLFASPVLAPLAAVALRTAVTAPVAAATGTAASSPAGAPPSGARRRDGRLRSPALRVAVLTPLVVVAALVLVFTRGLNTGFERTSADQVRASEDYYALAAPGDVLAVPAGAPGIAPFLDITTTRLGFLDVDDCLASGMSACSDGTPPRFVLLTSGQDAYGRLVQGRPTGWVRRFGDQLVARDGYRVVADLPEARLLQLSS